MSASWAEAGDEIKALGEMPRDCVSRDIPTRPARAFSGGPSQNIMMIISRHSFIISRLMFYQRLMRVAMISSCVSNVYTL